MFSDLMPKLSPAPETLPDFAATIFTFMSLLFVFVLGLGVLIVVVVYVVDVTQTKNAIRRNFPVIGRLRHTFERLGTFFRQYFFAMDREEMPFNREQRNWVSRAANDLGNTVAFGSTRDLSAPGTVFFVNCPFPALGRKAHTAAPIAIGPSCPRPYLAASFFNISGMSYGSISRPAVLALSRGAHLAGCWMNTGEGGLTRWHLEGGADLVFQIGSGKFGVRGEQGELDARKLERIAAHEQVRMFEIKLSQGAKPGMGGTLPAAKVTPEIAELRGIPVGRESVSPARHPEIWNAATLLDFIARVRGISGKPTGFKMVVGAWEWFAELLDEIASRGAESAPDFITVDGADGGSGAAPMSLIDCVGMPVHEGLPMVVDALVESGLRERVKVVASGKLITPADVAWALSMGADFVVSARGFMFALGCIQAMQCNKNTCPTGITTHDHRLQRGLDPADKAVRVKNYVENVVREVTTIGHSCGVAAPRELRRRHCRVVTADGRSLPLDGLFPERHGHRSKSEAA